MNNQFTLLLLLATTSALAQTNRVGIGTTTPRAGLDIAHNDGLVATGTVGSGNTDNLPTGVGTRLMWIPRKAAFRSGEAEGDEWNNDNIGFWSVGLGSGVQATKSHSVALGNRAKALAFQATAIGVGATASGQTSLAMGYATLASGTISTALGSNTEASGDYSTAAGRMTNAAGMASTALGGNTAAHGDYSLSAGYLTLAVGRASVATGDSTQAYGTYATALGTVTSASGIASTAAGRSTVASGGASTALGYNTTASGNYSTAMGSNASTNGKRGSFALGDAATTELLLCTADNQFVARFHGGYRLLSGPAYTTTFIGLPTTVQPGVELRPDDNAWSTISDSTKKEGFRPADGQAFLQKIARMRLGSWNYRGQDAKTFRHYGPMAQDFFAAFGNDGVGTIGNDTSINQADFDGVNLIAIKALIQENEALKARLDRLEAENKRLTALDGQVASLRADVESLQRLLVANTGK